MLLTSNTCIDTHHFTEVNLGGGSVSHDFVPSFSTTSIIWEYKPYSRHPYHHWICYCCYHGNAHKPVWWENVYLFASLKVISMYWLFVSFSFVKWFLLFFLHVFLYVKIPMFPNTFNFNMIGSAGVLFYRFLYCICLGKILLYSYLLYNFSFV